MRTKVVKNSEAADTTKAVEAAAEVKAETKTTAKKATKAAKTTKAAATKVETAAEAEEAAKKTTTKKAAVKNSMTLQFAGKNYTEEDLMKIAKDVWRYDLKNKVGDLKSVELYVKPEEGLCYYVMNGDVTGSFAV